MNNERHLKPECQEVKIVRSQIKAVHCSLFIVLWYHRGMKLHIVTIGQPKLTYAKEGWKEYFARLGHYHQVRSTHIPDKHNDAAHILEAIGNSYLVVMEIKGKGLTSQELSDWLEKRAIESKEVCFAIGGPDGLPQEVVDKADFKLSLGSLTYPHDLAMVILAEALYRASTITTGQPYHR